MALEDYQDKLDKLHGRIERRRLDFVRPTKVQIDRIFQRTITESEIIQGGVDFIMNTKLGGE